MVWTWLSTQRNLSTVTIRSTTVMVVDPITANPVAGEAFVITGTIQSDNGSALQLRNGDPLNANVLFTIDGDASGFTLPDGQIQANGTWAVTITCPLHLLQEHTLQRHSISRLSITIKVQVQTNPLTAGFTTCFRVSIIGWCQSAIS